MLCGEEFDEGEEVITDDGNYLYHHCCYNYMRCCNCKTKKLAREFMYQPEIRGFICDYCYPEIFFKLENHLEENQWWNELIILVRFLL